MNKAVLIALVLVLAIFLLLSWKGGRITQAVPPNERPTYKTELDGLLSMGLKFAKQELATRGEFHPFGGTIDSSGKIALRAALAIGNQSVDLLSQAFQHQAQAGEIRASGIFSDVTAAYDHNKFKNAIEANLEHRDGEGMRIYLPYEKGSDGTFHFGDLQGVQDTKRIFAR